MNVHARLAKLTTKKITPVKAPTPVVDLETEALAAKLMAQFSRPIATVAPSVTGEPTPAPVTELPKTMSVSDKEFQMLKSQKEAETRAATAEHRCEQLEKSLEVVTTCLIDFTMRQQEILNGCIGNLITDFQRDYAVGELRTVRTVSQLSLRLFVAWPQIADTALLNLDVTEEDIGNWRKWYRGYKEHDHNYWLNLLADVQAGKLKAAEGQPELLTELLRAEKVDVKRRLEEISAERLRRYESVHPILVSPRSGTYVR